MMMVVVGMMGMRLSGMVRKSRRRHKSRGEKHGEKFFHLMFPWGAGRTNSSRTLGLRVRRRSLRFL